MSVYSGLDISIDKKTSENLDESSAGDFIQEQEEINSILLEEVKSLETPPEKVGEENSLPTKDKPQEDGQNPDEVLNEQKFPKTPKSLKELCSESLSNNCIGKLKIFVGTLKLY